MLKIQKLSLVALMVSAMFSSHVMAAEEKIQPLNEAEASYAVGALMGAQLQRIIDEQKDVITYDKEKVLQGVNDILNGKVNITDPKIANSLSALDAKLRVVSEAKRAETMKKAEEQAKKAEQEGEKYRAEFAKKAGVKKTASGLLYLVDKAGTGEKVKPTDIVKVHYTGKLTDGTEFDSSRKSGKPLEFQLNKLIPGWIEGIPLIKKGGHIELVIPPELGYGSSSNGPIPANSTLYFDIELLDVTPSEK